MSETIGAKAHAYLDVASFEVLDTGWLSVPATLRLADTLMQRRQIEARQLTRDVFNDAFKAILNIHPAAGQPAVFPPSVAEAYRNIMALPPASRRDADFLALVAGQLAHTLSAIAPNDESAAEKLAMALDDRVTKASETYFGRISDGGERPRSNDVSQADQRSIRLRHLQHAEDRVNVLFAILDACASPDSPLDAADGALARLRRTIGNQSDVGLRDPWMAPPNVPLPLLNLQAAVPEGRLSLALSAIGLYKLYRHSFVQDGPASVPGVAQQLVALAPRERLEVVTQTTRRIVREDEFEGVTEEESESTTEARDTSDVTDSVSRTLNRSSNVSLNASAAGTVGVVAVTANVAATWSQSEQNSSQTTTRRVKELATKAADRQKRSIRIKTKNVQEFTDVNSSRRIVENETDKPINMIVRQAIRRERVIVQELATQLCWQCVVHQPGAGLKRSQLLLEAQDPEPILTEATNRGSSVLLDQRFDTFNEASQAIKVTLILSLPKAHTLDDQVPLAERLTLNRALVRRGIDGADVGTDQTMRLKIENPEVLEEFDAEGSVKQNHRVRLTIAGNYPSHPDHANPTQPLTLICDFGYRFRRSFAATVAKAGSDENPPAKFAKLKSRVTNRSQLTLRSPQVLRDEERAELLKRILCDVMGLVASDAAEYETILRLFDLDAMFYTVPEHLSAFPSDRSVAGDYPITMESKPAPFGLSLPWQEYQWDADRSRNALLNAPFANVCLPIRIGCEKEALEWLSSQVEGDWYSTATAKATLKEIASVLAGRAERLAELATDENGMPAPEDVAADAKCLSKKELAKIRADPSKIDSIEKLFPVIDIYSITTPVDGFFVEPAD